MIKNKKYTPADVEGLKTLDLDEWVKDFNWPVNWKEVIEIEDKVKNVLNKRIEAEDRYYKIILISYKIFIEYSNYIYALLVLKKDQKIKFSESNEYFYSIRENQVPNKPIIVFPKLKNNESFLRRKLRTYKKLLRENKLNVLSFFLGKNYFFVESRSPHTINFLKRQKCSKIV